MVRLEERTKGHTDVFHLRAAPSISGTSLRNAPFDIDDQTGRPIVILELDDAGAEAFGSLTDDIVGEPLAVVFEGELFMAPVVRERISEGRARIDIGGSTSPADARREARELSAVLQAGAFASKVTLRSRTLICE